MSISLWCVLIACLLPVLTMGMAKVAMSRLPRREGGFDNENPREWEAKLTGWKSRAHAAQLNGFEALPLFIAGVVFAKMDGGDPARIDLLAISFVIIRCAYIAAYLANQATLRSLIWSAGLIVSIMLLAMGS